MYLNVASTGKIELMANWEDPCDDPQNGSPVDVEGKLKTRQNNQFVDETIISSVNLKYDLSACHQLGDTNHHWVYYSMRATTRFREYFPPNPNTSDATEEKEKKLRYEIDNHTITGIPVRIDIPNSARPPASKVAYVIPTFAWTQSEIFNGFVRTRLGGGLRIYLERPWFASGPDEQIAVVLLRPGEIMEDRAGQQLKIGHLVTLFGKDPVWASGGSNYSLTANDFLVSEKDGKTSAPERRGGTRVCVSWGSTSLERRRS
jgi:hypothetical protein